LSEEKNMNQQISQQEIHKYGFTSLQQYRFPRIVNLCVIRGDCPCQCIHCPVGKTTPSERYEKFGKEEISLQLFKKIVAEMSIFHQSTLRIHGVGEPLMWKNLSKGLEFSSNKNVRTWLFTSLITRDILLLEELVSNANIIEISINSFDSDNYKYTKGIEAFSIVENNLNIMREIVQKKNLSTRIIASRVESEDKQYDSEFITHWKKSKLLDDVFIRSYHDYNAIIDNTFQRKQNEILQCLVHWNRFNIDCDGSAVICFNELFRGKSSDSGLIFGNIRDCSICDLWHCNKLNIIRRAQMEKNYSIVNFTKHLPCINCSSCQPSGNLSTTSECQIFALKKENI
jgi:hypothetical protein